MRTLSSQWQVVLSKSLENMPSNKNAVSRYKYLDDLLSDRYHYYDIHDLTAICNNKLGDDGMPSVSQRCIEKDINYLEYSPFNADIERVWYNGKRCIKYLDPDFSIFTKALTQEERSLLTEVLTTLGQFDGLDHFQWFDGLKNKLGIEKRSKIISFCSNPYLHNSNILGSLYAAISRKQVIKIKYHTFKSKDSKSLVFHPYLLKQFNNRWFIIGAADKDGFILQFALDRVESFTPIPTREYKDCTVDLDERFEDMVGVSLPINAETQRIALWIAVDEYPYIETKPLHGSQKRMKFEDVLMWKNKFQNLGEGVFIELNCIVNVELIQLLMSFSSDVVVLFPVSLRDELVNRITIMNKNYLI